MDKSTLEKIIHEKAVARFKKEMKDFCNMIKDHPFASRIRLNNNKLWDSLSLGIFGYNGLTIIGRDLCTNHEELQEEIIRKYEKEEYDKLLNKVDELRYIFEYEQNQQ